MLKFTLRQRGGSVTPSIASLRQHCTGAGALAALLGITDVVSTRPIIAIRGTSFITTSTFADVVGRAIVVRWPSPPLKI